MPTHEFLLLPANDGNYAGCELGHFNDPNAIKIDDDLVRYFMDTLEWIPTINPSNPTEWCGHGLNYYGPTVINRKGAGKAASIFRLWAALLLEGPANMQLTGGYESIEGEMISDGRYASVAVSRDSVTQKLQKIADFAEQAASGDFFVLHLGI